jgi:hypothetical protein
MLLNGEKDLRVVPHFFAFRRNLKARNVPCECVLQLSLWAVRCSEYTFRVLTYPESNHPLEEVDVESDFVINTARWFEKYLN